MLPLSVIVSFGLKVLNILSKAFQIKRGAQVKMHSLIKLDMESSLVIELKIAFVDTRCFVGLTPVENSQFNLGKSRDEFKSGMKQGT